MISNKKLKTFVTVFPCVVAFNLMISVPALAQSSSFADNFGRVGRLYPDRNGVYFTLNGGQTSMNPRNGYYRLLRSHPNYESLVDLLYMVTENNWTLQVRTENQLDSNGHAQVNYFVVDR